MIVNIIVKYGIITIDPLLKINSNLLLITYFNKTFQALGGLNY